MRNWAQQNRFGNVSTSGFVAAAERISGMELDPFFQVWLYEVGKPTSW